MHENLGRTATDVVTGFEGVATGYVQYLTGCNQYLLVPKAKDGTLGDSHWFDEQRLKFDRWNEKISLDNADRPGCDKAAPKR